MTSIGSIPKFMTGINYLDYIQYSGQSHGNLKMLNRRFEFSKNLHSKDLFAHYGCVNALEFSKDGEWLVSGGDDKRVLLWNVDRTLSGQSYEPKAMKSEHNSNIFCLGFSSNHTKIFSGGNDEQIILHDANTGEVLDVFFHDDAVYGLSVDPVNDNVFASACDDGHILIWDIRIGSRTLFNDPFTLAKCTSAYHAVTYNPTEPRFLATANAKDGVCLWDVRKPKVHVMKYGPTLLSQSAMSVCFNSNGSHLLALRRRFPPVLYKVTSTQPVAGFDHPAYYNSCTMKTCCFAGDQDQYVLSGSDDFKLYVWKIPNSINEQKGVWVNKAQYVLRGHRSIVNQVRYNGTFGLLASSGVEKIVKLWSSFPLSNREGLDNYVSSRDQLRKVYSHEEYINLVLEGGHVINQDLSNQSTQEDQRMMAFFDSLVQRDIEGWTSDSNDAADFINTCSFVQSSESSDSDSSSSEDGSPDSTLPLYTSLPQNGETSQERADPSLDMISILITLKRKEQTFKSKKMLLKGCKRHRKAGKKGCKRSKTASENLETSRTSDSASEIVNPKFLKTVRKVMMGRKKLAKVSGLSENSSNSDDSDCEPLRKIVLTDSHLHDESGDETCTGDSTVNQTENDNNNNSSDLSSVVNEDAQSSDPVPSTSSNSNVFFSGKKRKGKNYRKRSADDIDN